MLRRVISRALLTVAAVGLTTSAYALPLTGSFSKTGTFRPVDATTGATASLIASTGLDFLPLFALPGTQTPGVAGTFLINAADGDFLALLGTTASVNDFAFAGAGSASFPTVPLNPFEFAFFGTDLTFELTSISISFQGLDPNSGLAVLQLGGTGIFRATGFDDTVGKFVFTGNQAGSTFSFSASQTTVPEPASMALFGLGMLGVGVLRRREGILA